GGIRVADDEHVPVSIQRGPYALPRRLGRSHGGGRQRDLVGKDVGGAGRQYRLTPLDDLARQPKHRRGLAAPSDQRDDIAGGDAERLGQGRARQPRAPAAARSISSLAPAWIHGKKLVI